MNRLTQTVTQANEAPRQKLDIDDSDEGARDALGVAQAASPVHELISESDPGIYVHNIHVCVCVLGVCVFV